ncbi:MAG: radical SAM protein [Elusimicrobiales bacterium]|jgi:radical SAM superfamily enzyme YgiQ (UPF0313 family)
MKILLVKPGTALADHIQPSLGLAYLAGSLLRSHEVEIIDFGKTGRREDLFKAALKRFQPDVVGFQCYTSEIGEAKKLAGLTRRELPAAVVVAGGPNPTLCPEETMSKLGPAVDYILRGETEETFPKFLENLHNSAAFPGIPGLVWRENGRLRVNEMSLIADLDSLPLPAWHLINPQEYPPAQHGAFFKRFPIAPIITTRGCPFSCSFCTAPILSGKTMRRRSAESVMSEIGLLYRDFGIREIHIVDDNFTLNKEHAVSILKKIIESGLPISLSFPNGVRINTLDAELLELMKQSGVYLISVGIESGSDDTLKRMNKQLTVKLIREKVELIRSKGIDLAAFFVIAFPDETAEDIRKSIDFSLELPLLRANYFTFFPLPLTPICDKLRESGEIGSEDISDLMLNSVPYAPKGLTRRQVRNLQREAFLRFYLRPRILFRNLRQVRSVRHLGYLVKRFYHWILM